MPRCSVPEPTVTAQRITAFVRYSWARECSSNPLLVQLGRWVQPPPFFLRESGRVRVSHFGNLRGGSLVVLGCLAVPLALKQKFKKKKVRAGLLKQCCVSVRVA